MQWIILFLSVVLSCVANAATYNLTSGSYPPCSTNWNVSGTTYTCNGNGRVTLAAGDILTSNTTITISANNGFSLNNNTIGSSGNRINLTSTYGTHDASATTTIWGNLTSEAVITLVGTTVNGTVITNGNINLTGGGVTGLVRSNSNTITTNGTNLSGGATAQSGMAITGGTLAGNFVMTSNNTMTLSGVVMTSGSISGASTVTIQNGSVLGSSTNSITISSNSGAITVNNSTVYGNLTAPNYSTVNVTNGANVYGSCSPNSTPANACGAAPVPLPPTPMNCSAGISSGITGSYYNNRTLTAPAAATRSDAPIDFNWGAAAPGVSGVNTDNFSISWTGYIRVTQTGAYRFQTVSDDGVRLLINGNSVIDRWNDHSATTDTTGDINLVAGNTYSITLQYYENAGDAVIRLQWRLPGTTTYVAIPGGPLPTMGAGLYECIPAPKDPVSMCSTSLASGITGAYFNNQNLTAPATRRRLDGIINFDWGTGAPGPAGVADNNFSVRWSGYVRATQSGVHRFQTNSDDGVRLYVNGDLLIDQWNDHSVTAHTSAAVNLVAGTAYPIVLEFYENSGFAVAQLRWQVPGTSSYTAIPAGPTPALGAGLYDCGRPSGYQITNNPTGITCAAELVTITALDADGHSMRPASGTTVALITSPATGVWLSGGVVNNSFTFSGAEESFSRYLQQTSPALLNLEAADGIQSGSSSITFSDAGLKFYSVAPNPIATQVAGVNGSAIVKAIKTNTDTGACEAIIGTGPRPVALAHVCINPATCMAGENFSVNGINIPANNSAAIVNYSSVALNFNANGEAPLTINYSDVGQIRLHGQLTLASSGNNPAVTLSGVSDPFIVKPYALVLSDVRNSAGTRILPLTAPANDSVNATGFVAAGEAFQVKVQAQDALGSITPNYGRETLTAVENVVIDIQSVVSPTSGDIGLLGSKTAFALTSTAGEFQNTAVSWNNVGTIKLLASVADGNYLGVGDVGQKPVVNVGRFYPDYFLLTNSELINSCGTFSYMSQLLTLKYKIEALGVAGIPLSNYGPSYGTMPTISYVSENRNSGVNLSRFSDGVAKTWGNGALTFNSALAMFSRSSPNDIPDGPFDNLQIGLQLNDTFDARSLQGLNMNASTTGACSGLGCTAISLGSTLNMRYGRLRLDDAFGPETADLPVNFATEFWIATGTSTGDGRFIRNGNDSCTTIKHDVVTYSHTNGTALSPGIFVMPLSGGETTGTYPFGLPTNDYISISGGDAGHFFTAPTNSAQGQFNVDVNLTNYPWLRFDWNQDGNYSDASLPAARFGFGSYRGHDRVIYWRERF